MSTLGTIALILLVAGMLGTYLLGFSAGRGEGLAQGKKEGKREGAVKAYAVGYDRGKRDRADHQQDRQDTGWVLPMIPIVILATIVVLTLAATLLRSRW